MAERAPPSFESRFLDTAHGLTHVLSSARKSSGIDVLCFPGWGLPGAWWRYSGSLGELNRVGRVHLVDVPGQPGLSEGRRFTYRADQIAVWFEELLDALGVERAHLMGVSMGALVALRAARLRPELTGALVLCAPAGFVLPLPPVSALPALAAYVLSPTRERSASFYDSCVVGPTQPLVPTVRAEVHAAFHQLTTGFPNRSLPPLLLRDRELEETRSECLMLLGQHDPVFSPGGTEARARRTMPSLVDVTIVPGLGHALELSPETVARAAHFLSGSRSSSSPARSR